MNQIQLIKKGEKEEKKNQIFVEATISDFNKGKEIRIKNVKAQSQKHAFEYDLLKNDIINSNNIY
jgi:hypothetical protein